MLFMVTTGGRGFATEGPGGAFAHATQHGEVRADLYPLSCHHGALQFRRSKMDLGSSAAASLGPTLPSRASDKPLDFARGQQGWEGPVASEFDDDKNFVLVETVAQDVYKYLDHLKDSRPTLGTRWIWELLQNARDVAPPDGVMVAIETSDSGLTLKHTGRPFQNREIAHLIFHGSTKAKEKGDLGRFGSGFLSTHLLSPVVSVRGALHDGRQFEFQIDRTGRDVGELRDSMDRSWSDFKQSAARNIVSDQPFSTQFEYNFREDARELIQAGLDQLKLCGPLVLAFSQELTDISVVTGSGTWGMARKGQQLLKRITIHSIECREDSASVVRYVAMSEHEDGGAMAMLLDGPEDKKRLALDGRVPRLYIVFPLVSTERVVLPGAINEVRFKPHEDRDGIAIDDETEGGKENRPLLEKFASCSDELLQTIAEQQWDGTAKLLSFDADQMPEWAKHEWFLAFLRARLTTARHTPLLGTRSGSWIAPKDSWIPYADSETLAQTLGELIAGWEGAAQRLAPVDAIDAWSKNLSNWGRLLKVDPAGLQEAFTVDRLAQLIASTVTISALSERLAGVQYPIEWLVAFLQMVHQSGRLKLFEDLPLLPSQSDRLKKRSGLWIESNIDERLKDIAEKVGLNVRDALLHPKAATKETSALLKPKSEEDALREIILFLKQQCKSGRMPAGKVSASAELFTWICTQERDYAGYISGFPVATADCDEQTSSVLELKIEAKPGDRPLAPSLAWPESLQPFVSLFARRRTLNPAFGTDAPKDQWKTLAAAGYVHASPLYVSKSRMDKFLPDEPLPDEAGAKGHVTEADVEVSDIALIDEKDIGLVDIARKNQSRASQLVGLLIELAHEGDARAFEKIETACQCGRSHNIYRAAWLIPIRERKWVPVGTDGKRQTTASAESLAALLRPSRALVEGLSDAHGAELLGALGISPADFALRVVADSEQKRVELIQSISDLAQAAGGDATRLREFTNEVRAHPELIEQVAKQKAERELVHRNQQIGKLVEELFEEELRAQRGLRVERRHVGADFEVDNDYTENGQEIVFELEFGSNSTFIELKATRTEQAKMTPRQAEKACELRNRFALCVVAVGNAELTRETVRQGSRFVFGIGDQLAPVLATYESIVSATATARDYKGPIGIDMTDGQYRFRVDREIWAHGLTMNEAVRRIVGYVEQPQGDSAAEIAR